MSRDNKKMFAASDASALTDVPKGLQTVAQADFIADLLGNTGETAGDHIVALPSGGKFYPPNHPLHMVESVQIRSMNAGDEDILRNRALFRSGKIMSELLRKCIVSHRVNPADMLVGDRTAVLAAIAVTGYGVEVKTDSNRCGSCGTQFQHTFNLQSFEYQSFDGKPVGDENNPNQFAVKLPVSGTTAYIRFDTGADEEAELKRAAVKGQAGADVKPTDDLFRSMVAAVPASTGEVITDRTKLRIFCERMAPLDAQTIRNFRESAPTLKMEEEVSCPSCGGVSTLRLPVALALFRSTDS